MRACVQVDQRWVSLAFTCSGLRALGVEQAALDALPLEFREGMWARAEVLGDSGANARSHWSDRAASPGLHAIAVLFARDAAERARGVLAHDRVILLAVKLMGRRSGAPLVLAPDKDDAALGADAQRNNDFNYRQQEPHGYAVPLGAHILRMNPRDTAANMNRRRMIRRGATYGPSLAHDMPEDGVERGIAAFVLCASLIRQFEFVQNVWANDRNFHELGNERDPIIGHQDGRLESRIPHRPVRRRITGLPGFTSVRGGA